MPWDFGSTDVSILYTTETDTSKVLKPDGSGGVVWGTDASGLSFNDAEGNPAAVAGSSSDGTSAYAARRDHIHVGATAGHTHEVDERTDMFSDTAAPAAIGTSNSGVSTYAARRDHAHAGAHSALSGIGANDHHNQSHVLDGADHTVSGLTTGHFLKATGATTFGFAVHGLTYSDVGAADAGHTHAFSDHGALTGLSDDDHTDYLLATGARTGGSAQAQTFTYGMVVNEGGNNSDFRVEGDTDENVLVVDASADAVGIGTAAPQAPLHVSIDGTTISAGMLASGDNLLLSNNSVVYSRIVSASSTANFAPILTFGRARGTLASPTIVQSGDLLGSFTAEGFDGSLKRTAASISFFVDGTPGASDMPGRITFATAADGASFATERVRITNAGAVGIGSDAPGAMLHVNGAASGITAIFRANATTPGNLTEWQTSGGVATAYVDSAFGLRAPYIGIGGAYSTTNYPAYFTASFSNMASSAQHYALLFQANLTRTAAGGDYTAITGGIRGLGIYNSSYNANDSIYGISAAIDVTGTGQLFQGIGVRVSLSGTSGNLAYAKGLDANLAVPSGRTTTDYEGVRVTRSGTGTLTLAKAFKVESTFTATTAYSLYSDCAATMWHKGNVGLGTTAAFAPNALLDVRGSAIFNEAGNAADDFRVESDTEANMLFVDADANTDGSVYLGGTTNGIEVKKGGDLTLLGTAKYERHVQLDAVTTGAVANQPTDVDFFTAGGLQYPTTGSKFAFCQWEIPDDWDGTDVVFEIDWFPDSAATTGTDAVRWTVEYRSIAEGETINNGTSVTLDNGAGGDTADYSQYQTKHSRFTLVYNNANQPLTAQDHVYFKISRDTTVANDFGGTVTVSAYEVIYQSKGFPTSN